VRVRTFAQEFSENDWLRMLMEMGVRAADAPRWAPAWASEIQPQRFSAGMPDLRAFTVTFLHETGMLRSMEEKLGYSVERLMAVWPRRFPSLASAMPYAANPEALANFVYGGRMGNSHAGDGWRFRGRAGGITGRTNYTWLSDKMGVDLLENPDLLLEPRFALEASFYVWERLVPDTALSDQTKVRRAYNGGLIGMDHCRALYELCTRVMPA
jgi:putative chitinase